MSVSPSPVSVPSGWIQTGCATVLALAALAAYHNSLRVPFLFDDTLAIVDNPTIRDLGNLKEVLLPDIGHGITVSGRPVLNLSLALCHAVSGTNVWSYHAFNLLVHVLAGLTLFGVVRRTLMMPRNTDVAEGIPASPFSVRRRDATPLALAVALLWTLHPLQTESVTYIIQRAESMMGLFFLLTLYCFARSASSSRPLPWRVLAVLACLCGVGTKEVAAVAPLLVFLYDRTFVAGSFREAWRQRREFHLCLAATWVPLALLVAGAGWDRGGTAGFVGGVGLWDFWLTQFKAVAVYLKLAVWPHPLVFEYGTFRLSDGEAALFALIVLPLILGTAVALVRRPAAGFLGAWFLMILAPTSLLPGTMQIIVEHRMYLPLAAVIAGFVFSLHVWLGGPSVSTDAGNFPRPLRSVWLRAPVVCCLALALPLGLLTERRNRVYRDDLTLWSETVAHSPGSAKAQGGLGTALHVRGRPGEAIEHFLISLALDPTRVDTRYNTGLTYATLDRLPEAIAQHKEAIRINPLYYPAHYQLGVTLLRMNRPQEAMEPFAETVRLNPDMAEAHYGWGVALARTGRLLEAVARYQSALRIDPGFVAAEGEMGTALFQLDRVPEAAACFRRALQLQPDLAELHFNLGLALGRMGSMEQATAEFAEAVRLDPTHVAAQFNLGMSLAQSGRVEEALGHLRKGVELEPASPEAHCNLGTALARTGRLEEAVDQFRVALRLRSDYVSAHFNLGHALFELSRAAEARDHFESALRIDPAFEPARQMLEKMQAAAGGGI